MSLTTRQTGPNAKGAPLTNTEMDGNLLYLEQLAQSASQAVGGVQVSLTNPQTGDSLELVNGVWVNVPKAALDGGSF